MHQRQERQQTKKIVYTMKKKKRKKNNLQMHVSGNKCVWNWTPKKRSDIYNIFLENMPFLKKTNTHREKERAV